MENNHSAETMTFFARLSLAFRLIFNSALARRVQAGLEALAQIEQQPAAPTLPPERVHASGLMVLSALQREGRLIDFLQQDVATYSDEEVGAAARVVHEGCRKLLTQYFEFEPAVPQAEGSNMVVPQGFDAHRIRLTGNVTGQPPFKGTLKHHGWAAKDIRLPAIPETLDLRVLAPAEVELA